MTKQTPKDKPWMHTRSQWAYPAGTQLPRYPWKYAIVDGIKYRWHGLHVERRVDKLGKNIWRQVNCYKRSSAILAIIKRQEAVEK